MLHVFFKKVMSFSRYYDDYYTINHSRLIDYQALERYLFKTTQCQNTLYNVTRTEGFIIETPSVMCLHIYD